MFANSTLPQPVTLSPWPSCTDCLTWCQEHLAVAGSDSVSILTPRRNITKRASTLVEHHQWDISVVRVNTFSQAEWPEQSLANLEDMSIGEEQSLSTVSALSWSPPGLGIHRRSVLAVLTTNLLLSIWESDGTMDKWERTCIVNHYLAASSRRASRIRRFAWAPVIQAPVLNGQQSAVSKWGIHHLIIADDDNNILVQRLSKDGPNLRAKYRIETVIRHKILPKPTNHLDAREGSLFHRAMTRNKVPRRVDVKTLDSSISQQPGHSKHAFLVVVQYQDEEVTFEVTPVFERPSIAGADSSCLPEFPRICIKCVDKRRTSSQNTAIENWTQTSGQFEDSLGKASGFDLSLFDKALMIARKTFDQTNNLDGHVRLQVWGAAKDANSEYAGLCFTLHPSDMVEYSTPGHQTTTVVFERLREPEPSRMDGQSQTDLQYSRAFLQFVDAALSYANSKSRLDMSLVLVAAGLCRMLFPHEFENLRPENLSAFTGVGLGTDSENSNETVPYPQNPNSQGPEVCDICGSAIGLDADRVVARCTSGHQFTRCQISFTAIQEPGISKYCSQCGRQFLDLEKLRPEEDPCLNRVLFAEFDVCPYCHGKFCG